MAFSKVTGAGVATDTLKAEDIAADAIGTAELANDVSISTSGNIATTGSGTLAVAGTSTHTGAVTNASTSALQGAVTLNSGSNTITLPTIRSTKSNYVLAMSDKNTGTTAWQATATAPTISDVSGSLNHDQDSTLTLFGADFKDTTEISLWNASSGGTQVGGIGAVTNQTASRLEATFGHGGLTAGDTVYVEGNNAGIKERFQTAFTVSTDPDTITFAGASGTSANTTTHLGTYGGQSSGGGELSSTITLLNFDRGGGTDIEDSSNISGNGGHVRPRIDAVDTTSSTNAVIVSSPFGDGKSAMFFDGTDDTLTCGVASADFDISPSDSFTIELWLNRTVADGSQGYTRVISRNGAVTGWALTYNSSGNSLEFGDDEGGTLLQSNYVTVVNRWYHVAIVGDGTNVKMYIDGVEKDSKAHGTLTQWATSGLTGVKVAQRSDGTVEFGGYIDEIRIVKGTAVYTGDFKVPTSRFSDSQNSGTNIAAVTAAQTKLLIHSNNYTDAGKFKLNSTTMTANFALESASSSNVKFTGDLASYDFDGTNRVVYNNIPISLSANSAITLDFWFNADTPGSGNNVSLDYIYDWRTGSDVNGYLYTMENEAAGLGARGLDSDAGEVAAAGRVSGWNHFVYVRDINGNYNYFCNGTSWANGIGDSAAGKLDVPLTIGMHNSGSSTTYPYDGRIDHFRISDISTRYTYSSGLGGSGITLTVPTSAPTTDANTLLLVQGKVGAFTDSATTGTTHTITATGSYHSNSHGGIAPAMTWPANGEKHGSSFYTFTDNTAGTPVVASWRMEGSGDLFKAAHTIGGVDFWMNMDGTMVGITDNDANPYRYPSLLGVGGTFASLYLARKSGTETTIRWSLKNGSSTTATYANDFTLTPYTWHHIALLWDATTHPRIYIDGYLRMPTQPSQHLMSVSGMSEDYIMGGGNEAQGSAQGYSGYVDNIRIVKGINPIATADDPLNQTLNTGTAFASHSNGTQYFVPPTASYGATLSKTIPTITFTGALASGSLSTSTATGVEDIEFSSVTNNTLPSGMQSLTDSKIGLTLSNLTGDDANKATLTGTISDNFDGTSRANLAVKAQVRKKLTNAAYDSTGSSKRLVTFSSPATTGGLSPGMEVTGTGIAASTTITSIDSATTLTLSADTTGGALTNQTLIFGDPERAKFVNGGTTDALVTSDSMLTIAASAAGAASVLFNGRRYRGTDSVRSITGFTFKPDLLWIKSRSNGSDHAWMDSVRGPAKFLDTATAVVEDDKSGTEANKMLMSFDSDGFTLGGDDSAGSVNYDNTRTYMAWGWKAGGAPSANDRRRTDGSTSEDTLVGHATPTTSLQYTTSGLQYVKQSVNSVGDFSITEYQGASSGVTVKLPHGLSGAPDFMICKAKNSANGWLVWHNNLTATTHLVLENDTSTATSTAFFNSTAPDSTHVTLGHNGYVNSAGNLHMMYAWKAVAGVSKFGMYSGGAIGGGGTNSELYDGITLGFTPKFVMIKRTDAAADWVIIDSFRGTGTLGNTDSNVLMPSLADDEELRQGFLFGDIGSGNLGMKNILNSGSMNDQSTSSKYIYAAFA